MHAPRPLVHQSPMYPRLIHSALICTALVAGCTQFPELDRTITPQMAAQDFPALVPIEPLLAKATANQRDPAATQAGLQSRVAGLRARAAALRGGVLSGAARQRLSEGLH
ncbi:MAG: hypothetical protein ACSHWZ_05425 [Sulfitobacter sp.]